MIELELLSGSAVSAVGVDDLPETSTISCDVENGALIGKKRSAGVTVGEGGSP